MLMTCAARARPCVFLKICIKILLNKKNRSRAEWHAIYKFRLMYIYIYGKCVCVCVSGSVPVCVYTQYIITDFCSPLVRNFFSFRKRMYDHQFYNVPITAHITPAMGASVCVVCELCFMNNIFISIIIFPIADQGLKNDYHNRRDRQKNDV